MKRVIRQVTNRKMYAKNIAKNFSIWNYIFKTAIKIKDQYYNRKLFKDLEQTFQERKPKQPTHKKCYFSPDSMKVSGVIVISLKINLSFLSIFLGL